VSRLVSAFDRLRSNYQKAFIAYVMAGGKSAATD